MAAKTAGVLKVSQVSYLPLLAKANKTKTTRSALQINPNLQMGEKKMFRQYRVDVCVCVCARERHADNNVILSMLRS